MNKVLATLTAAVLLSSAACAAEAQDVVVSRDVAIRSGDWLTLASAYPQPYVDEAEQEAPSAETLSRWWEAFGDEKLTRLISQVLEGNKDLVQARARVAEARAALGVTKAGDLPWLDNSDSWSRGKTGTNSTGDGNTRELYRLGVDASWEIDIFGAQALKKAASAANLEARHADLHSVWVSLSSETAINYLSLRTLQKRLAIAKENLALQEESLSLVTSMHKSGLADALALSQSQYTVETTRSGIPTLKANIEQVMNNLALLAGVAPGALSEELGEVEELPLHEGVPLVGIPAEYLRQRPDIRSAERDFAAQIARRRTAEKDLLPKFTLVGSVGLESFSSGSLFSSDSFGWSFGPRISLPIFHGGAIRAKIRVQSAVEERLLAAYEQTVLSAATELRNALESGVHERERNKSLNAAVTAASVARELALDKYRNGLSDLTAVITAEANLLSLEDQYVMSNGEIISNIVRVYKALGGGWAALTPEQASQANAEL